jgi:D-alanine-D-alanine ligase
MIKAGKLRVGVIFGGRSGEHEVSLMSARSVLNALDREKYEVIEIGITPSGEWQIGENLLEVMAGQHTAPAFPAAILPDPTRPNLYHLRATSSHGDTLESVAPIDVFFPVLHGTFGEDGALQGVFEMQSAAYVGAGVLGSAVGMDKGLFRDVMVANRIPVLENLLVLRSEIEDDLEAVVTRAESLVPGRPYPLFVKPANLGSSVGVSKCHSRSDLMEGLIEGANYDRRILVQRAVNAREIEVSVLGNDHPQVSIPGEIIPSREFYSYEAKYIDDLSEQLIPAPLSPEQSAVVQELAVRAFQAIDCAGMARVDFLLDKDTGDIYLNEVNTIPGFTNISMYSKLWEASGLPYPALLDRLIELALEKKAERDRTGYTRRS